LAVEEGLLDPRRAIQIGIRGGQNFTDGIEFSQSNGMRIVFIEEFAEADDLFKFLMPPRSLRAVRSIA